MSRRRPRKTDRKRQEDRRFSVRAIRRESPDVQKLSRAFIGIALARAKAEAEAQAAQDSTVPPSSSGHDQEQPEARHDSDN